MSDFPAAGFPSGEFHCDSKIRTSATIRISVANIKPMVFNDHNHNIAPMMKPPMMRTIVWKDGMNHFRGLSLSLPPLNLTKVAKPGSRSSLSMSFISIPWLLSIWTAQEG